MERSLTNENKKIKLDFKESKYATGRRKTSIAKVWLKKGSGKIYVNGKDFQTYFPSENHKIQIGNNVFSFHSFYCTVYICTYYITRINVCI